MKLCGKYSDGNLKRTLKRELRVRETELWKLEKNFEERVTLKRELRVRETGVASTVIL